MRAKVEILLPVTSGKQKCSETLEKKNHFSPLLPLALCKIIQIYPPYLVCYTHPRCASTPNTPALIDSTAHVMSTQLSSVGMRMQIEITVAPPNRLVKDWSFQYFYRPEIDLR